MAVGIREVPLAFGGRCSIRRSCQAPPGHRVSRQRLEIRLFHTGNLSYLNRILSSRPGLGRCHLSFLVQIDLLTCRCIRFLGGSGFGPCLLCFLVPLPRCCSCGFRFNSLPGLRDLSQAGLPAPQFIWQVGAAVALAIAPVFLGMEDLGIADQGTDQTNRRIEALKTAY